MVIILNAKGMTNMNYSKETIRYADILIRDYAKQEVWSKEFQLTIDSLSEFDLEKFAALIMLDDDQLASEATSLDNPAYQHMKWALIRYLKNSVNTEFEKDFVHVWRRNIVAYHEENMKELLQERLECYNNLKTFDAA